MKIRSLQELCVIKLQKRFKINHHDPNDIKLKIPEYAQEIFIRSYKPKINLSNEQINYARNLLKQIKSLITPPLTPAVFR